MPRLTSPSRFVGATCIRERCCTTSARSGQRAPRHWPARSPGVISSLMCLFHRPDAVSKPIRHGIQQDADRRSRSARRQPPSGSRPGKKGKTGYPLVDAGMRQLQAEGWMHNRVRMVVASFLIKDLHIGWWHGADWFMECLRDGDIAQNQLNWQWVAGCGTDAAPYFRIFNPTSQAEKFDPDGELHQALCPGIGRSADRPSP